jgi:2,3,4,5-tetrahydropyridine-2-carboxylate N-succinyltransferase
MAKIKVMTELHALKDTIEHFFAHQASLKSQDFPRELRQAVDTTLQLLDKGDIRVAEYFEQSWVVNEWIKKAILLAFKAYPNHVMGSELNPFYDKLPLKYTQYTEADFTAQGARIVPGAIVRHGAYIGKQVILMPSFVNIGAFIGEGTMVDTWATVGSCAQIGKNVHLSGGVGIGGVLEPLQASPTIIEDNCFIGARSEIVEGVIVERNSVLAMGVFLSQSTKIVNRLTGEILYGRIPAGSVVVPGSLPSGSVHLACAVIVKQVDEQTRKKTAINDLLRDLD